MTEEEYFRKNYPDYCYGNRLLSPYWDLFQDGVEFGERQSEKEIADLKETNAILSESASINHEDIEYKVSVIEQRNKRIAELKQQIEKMKCCANCRFGYCEKNADTYYDQLTKAKKIVKTCVCIINRLSPTTALLDKNERSLFEQAEQFLKEIEK